jgi:hypothetical protein
LEYLSSEESRLEFKYGRLQLKVSNFLAINRNAWMNAARDPKNWTTTDGRKDIGINPTIGNISLILPQQQSPQLKDIPGGELPGLASGQTESGIQSQAYNRAGRRDISRNGPMVNSPAGKGGIAKGAAIVDFIGLAIDQYVTWAGIYDQNKIDDHRQIAQMVAGNITRALNEGMIPSKYQNQRDIGNIMNVILQGVNNSDNKELYDIGMDIYKKYNPKPEIVTVRSGLDNQPSKTLVMPKRRE